MRSPAKKSIFVTEDGKNWEEPRLHLHARQFALLPPGILQRDDRRDLGSGHCDASDDTIKIMRAVDAGKAGVGLAGGPGHARQTRRITSGRKCGLKLNIRASVEGCPSLTKPICWRLLASLFSHMVLHRTAAGRDRDTRTKGHFLYGNDQYINSRRAAYSLVSDH